MHGTNAKIQSKRISTKAIQATVQEFVKQTNTHPYKPALNLASGPALNKIGEIFLD